jgi:hypothetical protein
MFGAHVIGVRGEGRDRRVKPQPARSSHRHYNRDGRTSKPPRFLSAVPSHWALQYFDPSVGTQLQAGFAHFLSFAIGLPPRSICVWPFRCDKAQNRRPPPPEFS